MPVQTKLEPPRRRTNTRTLDVPLNRVEGDLAIKVELCDDVVVDAWSSGTMYRGIENILVGRSALDGLVITPRICGICSTAHLAAAAQALDNICEATPPPDSVRIRNLALMTEFIQSDMRQSVLMFMVDFANEAYADDPLYEEAVRRYAPFKGESIIEVVKHTKDVIGIVAILGGQWPHSSYMVPGGVATIPSTVDLLQCRHLLSVYREWYERRILGCSIGRWLEVRSRGDLDAWLEESPAHRDSDLGFFVRYGRRIGLDRIGRGHGNFVCAGGLEMPEGTDVRGRTSDSVRLIPAGFACGVRTEVLEQESISEHVGHSWFEDYEGGLHPFAGVTRPYATGKEGRKYSWAKAPRYKDQPCETGPLAEMIVANHPLFRELVDTDGASVFARCLARLTRPAELMGPMAQWLSEITADGTFYSPPMEPIQGQAFGMTEAARGALGHWIRIESGRIEHYQIITPTAWNGSPRDSNGVRGPWEEALVGTVVKDANNPVEMGHVVRSFDPCLVCTVHAVEGGRALWRTAM